MLLSKKNTSYKSQPYRTLLHQLVVMAPINASRDGMVRNSDIVATYSFVNLQNKSNHCYLYHIVFVTLIDCRDSNKRLKYRNDQQLSHCG